MNMLDETLIMHLELHLEHPNQCFQGSNLNCGVFKR